MFIRQRRITVAPFQSFLFLFTCLSTVSISSVYFIQTCSKGFFFSFFFVFPFSRFSPHSIFLLFFFFNEQAEMADGDQRNPDATDLVEVLHFYSHD